MILPQRHPSCQNSLRMEFNYYDSCLLTAICTGADNENGTDLKDIIAYIDYIDHSIITWTELFNGLLKLKRIKAVREKEKKLFPEKEFREWWLKKYENKKRIYISKQVAEVNVYLNKTYSSIPDHAENIQIELTEEDFHSALEGYKG